jgi:hypothetical protein
MIRPFFALAAVTACTHHKDIVEAHEIEGAVEITTTNGATIEAEAVGQMNRHKSFVAKDGSGVVPDVAIARIEDTLHGRGALEGLGIGALVGASVGAVLGYADGDDECNSDEGQWCILTFSAEEKAAFGAIGLGIVGGGIGLVVGALKGSTVIYEDKQSETVVRAVAPAGSQVGVTVSF